MEDLTQGHVVEHPAETVRASELDGHRAAATDTDIDIRFASGPTAATAARAALSAL
jgi:hypothetical protein